MKHRELYSDGIGRITVTGGVVRVDLESLSPTECDANNNPKSTFRRGVIFSLDGFVKSLDVMQKGFQGFSKSPEIRIKVADIRVLTGYGIFVSVLTLTRIGRHSWSG